MVVILVMRSLAVDNDADDKDYKLNNQLDIGNIDDENTEDD